MRNVLTPPVQFYQETYLMPMLGHLRQDECLTAADCGRFLKVADDCVRENLAKMDGFPLHRVGNKLIVPRGQLIKWLYEHPVGIAWRERREKDGKLPKKLDWRRYKRR